MKTDTEFEGWNVSVEDGPGVLGARTFVASSGKSQARFSAYAGSKEEAVEMLHDMIHKRAQWHENAPA